MATACWVVKGRSLSCESFGQLRDPVLNGQSPLPRGAPSSWGFSPESLVNGLLPNWLSQQNHRTRGLKTEGDNSARQILNLVSLVCFCDVGGIGVSKIEAYGEVYGLEHLRDFAGAYAQARYGFALGRTSTGELWLQNEKGVIMHLTAKREGLMLSLGGDAVVIEMNQ